MQSDSATLEAVKTILETKFPDDTCQLIAVKSILGIEITADEEPVIPEPEPTDPSTDPEP